MNITLVPPDQVMYVWNDAKVHLAPAVDRCKGRWTTDHLCAALATGRSQLWIAFGEDLKIHGALTTEITQYPGKKMLSMHFLGGKDFDDWYPALLEMITRYARDCGCDALEGVARFGFWKWLKKDGFEKASIFYEKDISDV